MSRNLIRVKKRCETHLSTLFLVAKRGVCPSSYVENEQSRIRLVAINIEVHFDKSTMHVFVHSDWWRRGPFLANVILVQYDKGLSIYHLTTNLAIFTTPPPCWQSADWHFGLDRHLSFFNGIFFFVWFLQYILIL